MRKPAILLIGPTGSGKTPLGQYIATHGMKNLRFTHFDFGDLLRRSASGDLDCGLTESDVAKLQQILSSGSLLEKETFYLAEKIISHFNQSTAADVVLLNGLPRHVEQGRDIAPYFDVRAVVRLQCDAQTVVQRIQSNSGRDRTHRADDDYSLVQKKLDIYASRTAPMCQWYSDDGVAVIEIPVSTNTQPEDIVDAVETQLPAISC